MWMPMHDSETNAIVVQTEAEKDRTVLIPHDCDGSVGCR